MKQTKLTLFFNLSLIFGIAMLILMQSTKSEAFNGREDQVPNNQWDCGICHQNSSGGGARTVFGEDVKSFGSDGLNVSWVGICDRDSDGDGFTNGQELGDPDCIWMIGDPSPEAMVTDPRDPESYPADRQDQEIAAGENAAGESAAGETAAGESAAGEVANEDNNSEESMDSADDGCDMSPKRGREGWILMLLSILGVIIFRRRLTI